MLGSASPHNPRRWRYLNTAKPKRRHLFTANRDIVDTLVEALIEAGELSGEQVDKIICDTVTTWSREAERKRRAAWNVSEVSAAAFERVY